MRKEPNVIGHVDGVTVYGFGSLYPANLCKPTIKPTKAGFKAYINKIYDKKRRK